jgi:hypothetical protein
LDGLTPVHRLRFIKSTETLAMLLQFGAASISSFTRLSLKMHLHCYSKNMAMQLFLHPANYDGSSPILTTKRCRGHCPKSSGPIPKDRPAFA